MIDASLVQALRRAMLLCALTVAWNTIVGSAAVATAVATGSRALIGFGLNAIVDSPPPQLSSGVSELKVWGA